MTHKMKSGHAQSSSSAVHWSLRLLSARWILLWLAATLVWFVSTGRVEFFVSIVVFGVALAAAILTPTQALKEPLVAETDGANQFSFETAYAEFADALVTPCLVIDERGVVRHVSVQARTFLPKLEQNKPISMSLRHPDLLSAIERCRELGVTQTADFKVSAPNETWFHANISCVHAGTSPENQDARNWIVLTLQDMTKQRRIEMMRSDFIANASHELRTPLTSLVGFIETLQGPAAKDEVAREKFLGIMGAQAARMSTLINDLLSLSRIELHQHVRPNTQVNLSLLLREVVESLQPQTQNSDVELVVEMPDENVIILGARNEIFEVLENLIDNAMKYGAGGKKIDIALRANVVGQALPHVVSHVVSVTDYGVGIASEHVPRLTERFYRVDAESSRQKKGTGLGLAIVKHIVHRHHGTMVIRSEVGVGTTIDISLPS